MRARDLDRLSTVTYDVLVIGGGIHGLAVAYEAASRGLTTALVEAADYGSGVSFNHQKTVHGGLRSLQSGQLGRASAAIFERRALARIAPWLLRPLPFLMGTYRSATRGRIVLRVGFKIDEWLGRHRNEGVEPELHLPRPRLISKAATLRLFPGVKQDALTGGAQWYDYQMVEAERLTFAFAAAADRAGADLVNYAQALQPLRDGGRVAGLEVRDVLDGRTLTVRARAIVNAAGAAAGKMMAAFGLSRDVPLLRAMNLVTSKRASDIALAAPGPGGRMLTLVPWRGRAIVGTSQSETLAQPGAADPAPQEIEAFVREANTAFPALHLNLGEITLVHVGLVPAIQGRDGRPALKPDADVLDHAGEGAAGAFSIVGVKYSNARGIAQRAVDLVARRLGKKAAPSRTATTVLPGAAIADHEALAIETARDLGFDVPLPVVRHLIGRYAEAAAAIIRLVHERADLGEPLSSDVPTLKAEVVHAIRHEQAVRLGDVVIRRTGLGAAEQPPFEAVRRAGEVAAAELGWTPERLARELDDVRAFYRLAPTGA